MGIDQYKKIPCVVKPGLMIKSIVRGLCEEFHERMVDHWSYDYEQKIITNDSVGDYWIYCEYYNFSKTNAVAYERHKVFDTEKAYYEYKQKRINEKNNIIKNTNLLDFAANLL